MFSGCRLEERKTNVLYETFADLFIGYFQCFSQINGCKHIKMMMLAHS
jgi:hypothetical protein